MIPVIFQLNDYVVFKNIFDSKEKNEYIEELVCYLKSNERSEDIKYISSLVSIHNEDYLTLIDNDLSEAKKFILLFVIILLENTALSLFFQPMIGYSIDLQSLLRLYNSSTECDFEDIFERLALVLRIDFWEITAVEIRQFYLSIQLTNKNHLIFG